MVNNVIHATYTETYDLNTAINELSLLAIHTPQANALKSMYKGFFENYKKYKIVGCSLGMVCASQQSLNPSEVGLTDGLVDPRDILNPILFKACTGENLNVILNQIYSTDTSIEQTSSLTQSTDPNAKASNMYYQLLSDDSWRKEHPQRGLFVKGLTPLVHKVVTTQPFRWTGSSVTNGSAYVQGAGGSALGTDLDVKGFGSPSGSMLGPDAAQVLTPNYSNDTVFISDGTTDMPWLDTTFDGFITDSSSNNIKSNRLIVSVPRVFCGVIVLPPAIVQRLFFRMQIQWHIMFKDFRPAFEVGTLAGSQYDPNTSTGIQLGIGQQNNPTYWNIYHDASTKLDKEYSSFDVNGEAEVSEVMQSAQ